MRNVKYMQNIELFKNGEIVATTTGWLSIIVIFCAYWYEFSLILGLHNNVWAC